MSRFTALAVVAGCLTALTLGCGSSNPPPASGGGGAPTLTPLAKDDLPAAEKRLAELEKTIAAKAKDLADLRAEADTLRVKIAASKGGGAGEATPLLELLATLPKEKWPKDQHDSLRLDQLSDWFAANLAGRRARYKLTNDLSFISDEKGGYEIQAFPNRRVELWGGEWEVTLQHPTSNDLRVKGLSEQAAERARSQKEPEVTFKLKSIGFAFGKLLVRVEDVALTGGGS